MLTSHMKSIQRQLVRTNQQINGQIEEILQTVMSEEDLPSRTDWDEIQKTIALIIQTLEDDQLLETLEQTSRDSKAISVEKEATPRHLHGNERERLVSQDKKYTDRLTDNLGD